MTLADRLADHLATHELASERELLAAVRAVGGHGVSRAAVERALAEDPRFEPAGDPGKARWQLAVPPAGDPGESDGAGDDRGPRVGDGDPGGPGDPDGPDSPDGAGAPDDASGRPGRERSRQRLEDLQLRSWQAEALAIWTTTCRGVVEAVTGTGKTLLAIAAAGLMLDRGARVLVLVPTLELQQQWHRELRDRLPQARVGRLGGGDADDLFDHQVLIATPQSAAEVPLDLPPGTPGLVIADEAHRYGAPTWGRALPVDFPLRLAMTATYERNDEGVEEVLAPYFGEVVYRYGYDRAVADGTVAPFSIALAGVPLDDTERASYDAADVRVKQLHRELIGPLRMPKEPRALLAAASAVVAEAGPSDDGPQIRACREYLVRIRERRDVAARARGKLKVVEVVAPALAGGRSLVFADTVEQADQAVTRLRTAGREAATVHGQLTTRQRRGRLAAFRRGDLEVVVAPRVLDEGVDVPAADIAVVLSAFRTRRQSIQRLGRVLRVKPDGREARLVLAHAVGTAEDPARGGHAAFLSEVTDVARRIDHLDVSTSGDAADHPLAAWLAR